jgi:hypothetical protein
MLAGDVAVAALPLETTEKGTVRRNIGKVDIF